MNSRLIGFANSAIRLESDPGPASSMVDFLFPGVMAAGSIPPHLTLSLKGGEGGWLSLHEAGIHSRTTYVEGDMAEWLLGRVGYHLADRSRGGVLFHAAALYYQGRGLILPGRTGAGKSTLTCWLLSRGFGYMSDEFAFLPTGDLNLVAFPRPLNIKRTAIEHIRPLLRIPDRGLALEGSSSTVISSECLSSARVQSQIRLGLVVLPRFQSGIDYSFESVDLGQAGLELMESVLNLRNLARHGLPEIAHLIRSVPVYRLSYGSFYQLEQEGFLGNLSQLLAKSA